MRKNIAIVTTWFPAGAGYVSKAYRGILEKDFQVFIYARQGKNMKGDPIWDDEYVYWAKKHYNGIDLKDFKRWLLNNKIDLVFFNEQRYWQPIIVAKKMGICVGAYVDYYTEDTVSLFSIYDFLICNTQRHYSVFNWHPACYFIQWGTDTKLFKPSGEKPNDKVKFIISLGWEGNYGGDRKGLKFAITAFAGVKGECELLVYSQVKLEECLLEWKELIALDNRIKFVYGTFDPFPFNAGDIYIYPSRLDGIGLSLPEALSSGLPAITTDSGPMNEFVENDFNGKLVRVERFVSRKDGYYWPQSLCEIESLRSSIQFYLDKPEKVEEHSFNARKRAQSELDWSKNAGKLNELFRSIMSMKSRSPVEGNIVFDCIKVDRKLSPSLTFRFLSLLRDYLGVFGLRIELRENLKNLK